MSIQSLTEVQNISFYQNQTTINDLPVEILQHIFGFLNKLSIQNMANVNKFYNTASIEVIKNLTFSHWRKIESFFLSNFFSPNQMEYISTFMNERTIICNEINLIRIKEFNIKIKNKFLCNLSIIENGNSDYIIEKTRILLEKSENVKNNDKEEIYDINNLVKKITGSNKEKTVFFTRQAKSLIKDNEVDQAFEVAQKIPDDELKQFIYTDILIKWIKDEQVDQLERRGDVIRIMTCIGASGLDILIEDIIDQFVAMDRIQQAINLVEDLPQVQQQNFKNILSQII